MWQKAKLGLDLCWPFVPTLTFQSLIVSGMSKVEHQNKFQPFLFLCMKREKEMHAGHTRGQN